MYMYINMLVCKYIYTEKYLYIDIYVHIKYTYLCIHTDTHTNV